MEFIQSVFNNREIAIAFWVIIVVTILIFTKAGKDFARSLLFFILFLFLSCVLLYMACIKLKSGV